MAIGKLGHHDGGADLNDQEDGAEGTEPLGSPFGLSSAATPQPWLINT